MPQPSSPWLHQLFLSLCQEWHRNSSACSTRSVNWARIDITAKHKGQHCTENTPCSIQKLIKQQMISQFKPSKTLSKKGINLGCLQHAHTTPPSISTLPGVCQRHENLYPSVTLGIWEVAVWLSVKESSMALKSIFLQDWFKEINCGCVVCHAQYKGTEIIDFDICLPEVDTKYKAYYYHCKDERIGKHWMYFQFYCANNRIVQFKNAHADKKTAMMSS